MDLGFGNANQKVGDAASRLALQAAKAQERAIEGELQAYDDLLDDDDALEILRTRRVAQLKALHQKKLEWKALGHGEYSELAGSTDVAKGFFEAAKTSNKLVVHFYRNSTRDLCDVFHAHLSKLAASHLETRFLKINVEGCDEGNGGAASYLVEKLGIVVMPTLVIVKDRKVVHHVRGFDELGDTPEFSTKALEYVLGVHGGVNQAEGAEVPPELLEQQGGVNSIRVRGTSRFSSQKGSVRDGTSSGQYDADEHY